MSQKILQINFKFTTATADHLKLVAPLADPIGAVPGLTWKIWMLNDQNHEAGGVYLFRAEASVNAYLTRDIGLGMQQQPTVRDMSADGRDGAEKIATNRRGTLE